MVCIFLAYSLGLIAASGGGPAATLGAVTGPLVLAGLAAVRSASLAVMVAVIVVLGAVRYTVSTHPGPSDVSRFAKGDQARVIGTVVSDPDIDTHRVTAIVGVSSVETEGVRRAANGRLWVRFRAPRGSELSGRLPDYGDRIAFNCFLDRPSDLGESGGFSWSRHLANQGIYAAAYSRWDGADIEFLAGDRRWLGRAVHGLRNWLVGLIHERYPSAEAGVVAGVLLGINSELPLADSIAFRRSGTYHLLAASGFNCLVIIVVFGRYLFPWLTLGRRGSHVLLIGMLALYAMVSGGRPSIVRAAIMAGLYLLAFLLVRVEDGLNILATAAVIILAARPGELFDSGFQLSFAAAASIIVILPLLKALRQKDERERPSAPRWMTYPLRESLSAVMATTAVTLGTAPIIAFSFNQLSLVSIPANAVAALIVLWVFVTACISLAIGWLPAVGLAANVAAVWVARALLWAVRTFGGWDLACVSVPSPALGVIAGYYLLLGVGVWYAGQRLAARTR